MTLITIPISEEHLVQLRAFAASVGLAPEELLRRQVEEFLDQSDEQFSRAAERVLKKNAELYRRLA